MQRRMGYYTHSLFCYGGFMTNYYSGFQPYNPYNSMMPAAPVNSGGMQISYTNGWVGAKGYSIPRNTTILLMDSDAPQFFIKQSDQNGMCTIKGYRFEEITEAAPTQAMEEYVTKAELKQVVEELMSSIAAKTSPAQSLL